MAQPTSSSKPNLSGNRPISAQPSISKRRAITLLCGLVVVSSVVVTLIVSNPADATASNKHSQESLAARPGPFGVPISDRVFAATLRLPNQEEAHIYTREGTFVSFSDDGKKWFALSPQRNSDGTVDWAGLRIDRESAAVTLLNPKDLVVLAGMREGQESIVGTPLGDLSLHFYDIEQRVFRQKVPENPLAMEPSELSRQFGSSTASTCCVTCGQTTLCSTATAELSCGSCVVDHEIVTDLVP